MSEDIFRKKSLDKVKSPDELDDYIQVSNPSVWLLLISAIVILAGACVWGIFGHIESTVPATVQIQQDSAVCYISANDITSVKEGLTVNFAGYEAVIDSIGSKKDNEYLCSLSLKTNPNAGVYEGKVIIQTYKPLSFILN